MASEQRWVTIVVRAWTEAAEDSRTGVRVRLLRTGHDTGSDDRKRERVAGSVDEAVAIVAAWLHTLASGTGEAGPSGAPAARDAPGTRRRRRGDAAADASRDASDDASEDGCGHGGGDAT